LKSLCWWRRCNINDI